MQLRVSLLEPKHLCEEKPTECDPESIGYNFEPPSSLENTAVNVFTHLNVKTRIILQSGAVTHQLFRKRKRKRFAIFLNTSIIIVALVSGH